MLLGVASVWYHSAVIPAVDPPDLSSNRFKGLAVFCGWGPDGTRFCAYVFETLDGRSASHRIESYPSEEGARRAHRENIRDGLRLARPTACGAASDPTQERALLTRSEGAKRWTVVTWRDGKKIHWISSEFADAALDLEAEYCQPHADP